MADQKPSVGRMVHYVSFGTPDGSQTYDSRCRDHRSRSTHEPARTSTAGLCVLNPTGQFFNRGVVQHEGDGGTWHWPERV